MEKDVHETFTDPDMNIFLEKGKRCDIFYISNTYNKVNQKCVNLMMQDKTQNIYNWIRII